MYAISNWKRSRRFLEYLNFIPWSTKIVFFIRKVAKGKMLLESKTKVRRYYFPAVFESRTFGWRTTEVGIDRQLCADEDICCWMFKVIDLIGTESVLWIPYAICFHIAIISTLISILFLAANCTVLILCRQTNFICYFFYFGLIKFDDKRRCGNVQFQVAGISWFVEL